MPNSQSDQNWPDDVIEEGIPDGCLMDACASVDDGDENIVSAAVSCMADDFGWPWE